MITFLFWDFLGNFRGLRVKIGKTWQNYTNFEKMSFLPPKNRAKFPYFCANSFSRVAGQLPYLFHTHRSEYLRLTDFKCFFLSCLRSILFAVIRKPQTSSFPPWHTLKISNTLYWDFTGVEKNSLKYFGRYFYVQTWHDWQRLVLFYC